VPAELFERKGAVSREVAAAMAEGIRRAARSDIGLSVTGIAGPGGGSAEKPVGLVFIGLASAGGVKVDERRFPGTRDQVRTRASQAALDVVRKHLIG
jgi:nicotinamide-nucleotide amidase